nr:hypothetical protein [Tanacetum cinerariifolium]
EGDILFERLLYDDPVPLPGIFDFRQALRMMKTPKGIFFLKDCFTMILFPFRTFLTSHMKSEFFFLSLPIR